MPPPYENAAPGHDIHTTILHPMGLNHEILAFFRNGRETSSHQ